MADIATVFHWSLSELREMELDDLADWHARAVERLRLLGGVG